MVQDSSGPVASRQDIIINNYACNITPYSQYIIFTVVNTNYLKDIFFYTVFHIFNDKERKQQQQQQKTKRRNLNVEY